MSNVENVCPQVLRGVAREIRKLVANPPAGIKVLVRDDDLTDVVALIDGPAETPYAGGVFRVRLSLGREFPTAPPRAFFLTRIFHPNVSAAGQVCVNTLQKDWRPELGLEHALLAIKCLLIAPNPDSALNAEAATLLHERYDDYFARAKLYTDIHAKQERGTTTTKDDTCGKAAGDAGAGEGPRAKRERRAASQSAPSAPPSHARDRRRILKRL
ncbi:ubiquitin-conjugating enzyme E2 S [Leptidea sinapis]|uniref:ubiquitin-conjugating enzyme E2 S n=1 Tax=Leptidea sinapis TaxID=189913 RepID=UPI00212F2390|nr:ubiquitin-conjugating enzyme E2 S [Leptidea sinapis]